MRLIKNAPSLCTVILLFSTFLLLFVWSGSIYASGWTIATYIPKTVISATSKGSWSTQTPLANNTINKPYVIVSRSSWEWKPLKEAHHAIRLSLIKQILFDQVVSFVDSPYAAWNANFALTVRSGSAVATDIDAYDDLDLIIDNALVRIWSWTEPLTFTKKDLLALRPIYLWKTTDDLKELWFEVVSSRYRVNKDPAYRRHNIVTAFKYLWHIKVLNPGAHFTFLGSIQYDESKRVNYKEWLAIVDDEEIPVYGWGICGGSTAAYQWVVTNTALSIKWRNHSKRFTNLYTATINGTKISTPGIDATVFAGSTDLTITNTSDHPIIIALNFNGSYGGVEEVLSLWQPQDRWSLEYKWYSSSTRNVTKKDPKTKRKYTEKVKTSCYTRSINGKNKTSCYKEIH